MESLPNELLALIGRYSRQDYRPSANLRALALCSRRLYAVFQHLLYTRIEFYSSHTISIADVRLVTRLWEDPKLASQVRHLNVSWRECDGDDEVDVLDRHLVAFIDNALDQVFSPEERHSKENWREHLLNSCQEAWLGLLLVRLTHLETFEVEHQTSCLMRDLLHKAAQRQRPFGETPPFPYLRQVRVHSDPLGRGWVNSDFLAPFFYFPAVRKIDGFRIADQRYRAKPLLIPHSSRPVREFTLSEVFYCRGMLDWLAACKDLECISLQLAVHSYDHYEQSSDCDRFSAPEFREALLSLNRTLKSLRIEAARSFNHVWEWGDDLREMNMEPFGSFKEFIVLENLVVRHSYLMRLSCCRSTNQATKRVVDMLPASLKSLAVTDIVDDDFPDLLLALSMLVQHQDSFPQLEQIQCHVTKEDDSLLSSLKGHCECEASGIKVKLEVMDDRYW